jgi:murein DD-endopeptidase MepM/ murein hydrolase activator NlpD
VDLTQHSRKFQKRKHLLARGVERLIARAFAWLATTFYGWNGNLRDWRSTLMRASAHLGVFVVALVALGLSHVEWPARAAANLSMPALSAPTNPTESEAVAASAVNALAEQNGVMYRPTDVGLDQSVTRLAQPHTVIPERPRLGVITYSVQPGDTVQTIAATFGLQPESIMWANPAIEDAPDLLQIGQKVFILPLDGVYHTVADGDTIATIAEKYQAEPDAIISCRYNNLDQQVPRLEVGMRLIVPGGEKPYVPKVVTAYEGPVPEGAVGSGMFQWPVLGAITQGYWYGHRAIDIGAPTGSALLAADAGFISFAGWTDVGYGYLVVIDHTNGFVTYYAHLSNIYVSEGQAVERGQVIGAVGSTGWSTGPHLHFEVRYNGVQHNPRAYLP